MRLIILALCTGLFGCRGLPATKGELQDFKVDVAESMAENAATDRKQSENISQVAQAGADAASVLVSVVPEEQKPLVKLILERADAATVLAQAMSINLKKAEEVALARAQEEKDAQVQMNAAPGAADLLGGAMTGDWDGVIKGVMGIVITYMTADKLRTNSRIKRIADKAVQYAELPTEEGKKRAADDPDLKKYAKKVA